MLDTIDDLLESLSKIPTQDLKWELTKLRAIKEWALKNLGIDYTPGDRVRIKEGFTIEPSSGWYPYAEALSPGATGKVTRIEFNTALHYWYADFILDREWSYSNLDGGTRYWNGPGDETPEGYKPPGNYAQKEYPEGRKHTFGIEVVWLEGVINAESKKRIEPLMNLLKAGQIVGLDPREMMAVALEQLMEEEGS